MQLWDNVGSASFRVQGWKVKLSLMCGGHDATIGVLYVDGFCGGSFVEDRAVETGVIGCASRVGCDDGRGTRRRVL